MKFSSCSSAQPPRLFRFIILLAVSTLGLALTTNPASAQSPPDALQFFKNYFVTGDYKVGGVGLRGQGDASGYATNTLSISGIPSDAVVVGAFLYWETVESSPNPGSADAFFQGYSITGKSIGAQTPPCWSSGGGTGSSNGANTLRVYRADVRPYLVISGQPSTNGSYQVRVRDSGSNGNTKPLAEGASLVVIYHVANAPLRAVVMYDGAYTVNNQVTSMNLTIKGFYQSSATAGSMDGHLTHIVGDGQANFGETLFFNNDFVADNPFTGAQGFSWDNYSASVAVPDNVDQVTTQVTTPGNQSDCLSWGGVVFSTPVKDQDNDGLLDIWEANHGYTDINDGTFVSLPGSSVTTRDIYVQVDYLTKTTGAGQHSHLLKQEAINLVGQAFDRQGIHLHVDAGNKLPASSYVIGSGQGGNAIEEDSLTCQDTVGRLCQFPNVAGVVSWKTGVHAIQEKYFPHNRKDSYRYSLLGHILGLGTTVLNVRDGSLTSVTCCTTSAGKTLATVTTPSAHNLQPNARVSIGGAISDWDLNGTYLVQSTPSPTTFTIAVTNVNSGVYGSFPNQALGVSGTQYNESYLSVTSGPLTSISGVGDLPGGDFVTMLGLWRADDLAGCQINPGAPLTAGQSYCDDQVGSALVQAGTWIHELGHNLLLPHAGFYPSQSPGGETTFGENCKSNHVSSMSYLFQIRGIPGGNVDYSAQTLPSLDESSLVEANGLGRDSNQQLPLYGTRWYAPLGFVDNVLQNTFGGRIAKSHCDGSPTAPGEQMVRVEGPTVANGQVAALDWNNNGIFTDVVHNQDLNFNGATNNTNMQGFNDWAVIDLRQLGARRNVGGFSTATIDEDVVGPGKTIFGGGTVIFGGGDDLIGGGADVLSEGFSGKTIFGGGKTIFGGGKTIFGGGDELTFETANATVESPGGLTATVQTKKILLSWNRPGFGRIRTYYIWRADITKNPMSPTNPPVNIGKVTGTPAATTFTDTTVKTNALYLYFITGALGADSGVNNGNQSGASNTVTVLAK
jgi:hypothetical protein